MDIIIKKEEEKDHKDIYEVNKSAFGQENESRLVEKIRRGNNFIPGLSLVAVINNKTIGHILFSKIKIIGSSGFETLALAPVPVLPEFQNVPLKFPMKHLWQLN